MSATSLVSPVPGVTLSHLQANGLTMRVASAGEGPLVLLCHGWPESWYVWRHQIPALAAAGFKVVAPDMRGYGGTGAPDPVEAYCVLDLVADMASLVGALGERQAVIVGHDWGAPVAWHCALLRPDLFRAVAGFSVPWTPPGKIDLLTALDAQGINDFYMQYFQRPGVAEAELEADIGRALRMIYFTASGDPRARGRGFTRLVDGTFLGNCGEPPGPLAWFGEADLAYLTACFSQTGFRGGLNWYRNLTRNWRLTQAWRHQPIRQPALFIAGARDGVLRFPASQEQIAAYPRTLPGCRGVHIIEGAGHWVQQEAPEAVSRLLVDFLQGLPG
jgi:pimeloyl-ACP methyl ester carboxylesterase